MEKRRQGRAGTWGAKPERPRQEGPGAEKRQRWRRGGEGRSPRGAGASPSPPSTPQAQFPISEFHPTREPGEDSCKRMETCMEKKEGGDSTRASELEAAESLPGPLA